MNVSDFLPHQVVEPPFHDFLLSKKIERGRLCSRQNFTQPKCFIFVSFPTLDVKHLEEEEIPDLVEFSESRDLLGIDVVEGPVANFAIGVGQDMLLETPS